MIHLLTTALHVFVVLMIATFIISGISALTGTYDHWGNRYVLKARRSRLIRQRARQAKQENNVTTLAPYKATKPNKRNLIFKGKRVAA